MGDGTRTGRVADEIRRIVGQALLTEVADDRLREVTLTEVKVSRDLGVADLYWVFLLDTDDADKRRVQVERRLERAGGFLRKVVARELRLRTVPELRFHFDLAPDRARRMEDLLSNLPAPAEDEEPV